MALKPIELFYQAKNSGTGLTVKAQVYKNDVAVAVGVSALTLAALDATNAPGFYKLIVSPSVLASLGFVAGDILEAEIDATDSGKSAPAGYKEKCTAVSTDDIEATLGTPAGASVSADIAAIETKLGSPAGASVSADIAAVKSDTAAIKVDLESGSYSLQTILSNIQSLQNASIGNGVGFVLPLMIIPSTGSTSYKIPITIQNNDGALIDPNSNLVTVGLLDSSGADFGAYLVGHSGSPATVAATKDSTGQYHVMVAIPSTAVQSELVFSFAYTIGSNAMVRYGVSQLETDMSASGFALQSTLLSVQSTVNGIDAVVTDSGYGNAALKSELDLVKTQTDKISNGTYGLAAIETIVSSNAGALSDIEGTSFSSSTDSLHAISLFLSANVFFGGRAF